MTFNTEGYLEPFMAIETDLASAKDILVWNEARNEIWCNFEAFLRELQGILQNKRKSVQFKGFLELKF
ncbi:hypothetical protein [Raineya sp.]|jgi:hypothetical protein